jgi:hypothetical protein
LCLTSVYLYVFLISGYDFAINFKLDLCFFGLGVVFRDDSLEPFVLAFLSDFYLRK